MNHWRLRTGRKTGRTLWLVRPGAGPDEDDVLVGLIDSPEVAEEIVERWNDRAPA